MNTSNAEASMFQILLNKFFTIFPPDFYLSWLVFIVLVLILLYLYLLPKRIHDEAIKEFEHKLVIQLTEVKNKLDTELEIIKLIRSQVEPQKIDAYLAIVETHNKLIAIALADQQNLPPDVKKRQIEDNKALLLLLSRLFFFASDKTINKYISLRNDESSPGSITLLSSPSFILYTDLLVSMRQDLHSDTQLDSTHFCSILGIKHSQKE